ncbi:hypothetical protein BJ170DRAFT_728182 [Xylariales sp. AK1849]|nr:hypothetical protein BJ170DRAFT_728182 [Xylariales sp. AK1849]
MAPVRSIKKNSSHRQVQAELKRNLESVQKTEKSEEKRPPVKRLNDAIALPEKQIQSLSKEELNAMEFEWEGPAKPNNQPDGKGNREPTPALTAQWHCSDKAGQQVGSGGFTRRPATETRWVSKNGWDIEYYYNSSFGYNRTLAIRLHAALPDRPVMFYAGDGVSDLSAAKATDLLFTKARRGIDLIMYCVRENMPFTVFNDFFDVHKIVASVVDGTITIEEAAIGMKLV